MSAMRQAMPMLGTFLWIGAGGRPTYPVVDALCRRRWPEQETALLPPQRWRLYTLDRKPGTVWPLEQTWPRCGHVKADFLTWEPDTYRPYDTVFVDNILCWGYATQSHDVQADTWESPTLQGKTRQQKLAIWATRLAALDARYLLTSGTADPDNVEDGDVLPDMTPWGYRLLAWRTYERRLYTGWYIWHRTQG